MLIRLERMNKQEFVFFSAETLQFEHAQGVVTCALSSWDAKHYGLHLFMSILFLITKGMILKILKIFYSMEKNIAENHRIRD